MSLRSLTLLLPFMIALPGADTAKVPPTVPLLNREFRAAWVATVANIDWPSKPGLPVSEQQRELRMILDKAVALHLNAIVLQVRSACDALYPSNLEPWSAYITGRMGEAPSPKYDPLALWVEEAHKRGLELHAWFNPYRAHHPSDKSPIAASHICRTHPGLAKKYGPYLWLDPGEPAVQEHSVQVIMDVVKRYDVDGIHMDDYFYPYKEKDSSGNYVPFPDDPSWKKYLESGGTLRLEDWRRDNVDRFIERLYREIKRAKPWVKFGISPFGIWRPGNPPQIQGYDQFANLYADARKWLSEGWVDYFAPQLYWKIDPPAQSYPVLLKWWCAQNSRDRHIWPGNYTGRISEGGSSGWSASEIVRQIAITRSQPGASGNIHFSMKTLLHNAGGVAEALAKGPYQQLALVPACPWLSDNRPARPSATVKDTAGQDGIEIGWKPSGTGSRPARWIVQIKRVSHWTTDVLPPDQRKLIYQPECSAACPEWVAVSFVDRAGIQSEPALVQVHGETKTVSRK